MNVICITVAVIDTPFYTCGGMNYNRGFQSCFTAFGQEGSGNPRRSDWTSRITRCRRQLTQRIGSLRHLNYDPSRGLVRETLQRGVFLYIDTWDPPAYHAELYQPDYDGSIIQLSYVYWHEADNLTERNVETASACYRGETTRVDTCSHETFA